ncbi:hypothetical protein OROMI_030345 [Orobanche minor]
MKTLRLCIEQQNSTAQRMAEILEAHPKVDGGLLVTAKFVDALKIPYIAPSFGGCESIVDQPAIIELFDIINGLGNQDDVDLYVDTVVDPKVDPADQTQPHVIIRPRKNIIQAHLKNK